MPLNLQAGQQGDSIVVAFHYQSAMAHVSDSLYDNDSLWNSVSALENVRAVEITAYSSPDGKTIQIDSICEIRAKALESKFHRLYPEANVHSKTVGPDWEGLEKALIKSNLSYSKKTLEIIRNTPLWTFNDDNVLISSRRKVLMELDKGNVWRSMRVDVFPELCRDEVRVYFGELASRDTVISTAPETMPEKRESAMIPVNPTTQAHFGPFDHSEPLLPAEHDGTVVEVINNNYNNNEESRKAECRLGTNLAYDALTVANLSLEVGFARHFAVNCLATFSPWDITPVHKFRTLLLNPDLRYYFANDFKGHYLGIEGHYGWYNIALCGNERYQDRDGNTPLWGAGISYGYNVSLSRHWGFDFGISAGYAHLVTDLFYNLENGSRYTTKTTDWWGPTKVGISIYYDF